MEKDLIRQTAEDLQNALDDRPPIKMFAGFDGFIDEILHVVDKRIDFNTYKPVKTIEDYAARLAEAAGKSTNVEFVLQQVKLGGNGPIMAESFGRLGGRVCYVGCLGWPQVEPLFQPLSKYGDLFTVAAPGTTLAAEFEDGKIMHGKHESLKDVTWDTLLDRLGGVNTVDTMLRNNDVCATVNWTMLPFLTEVFRGLLDRALSLGEDAPGHYFFDLADPRKRTDEDLLEVLDVISSFKKTGGRVIFGLNESESAGVAKVIGFEPGPADHGGLIERAQSISEKLQIPEVVIHPTRMAAVWSDGEGVSIEGPYCPAPKLTTGAGDNFNAGYLFGRAGGLSPHQSLIVGKATSGFYVREGRGPAASDLPIFCQRWAEGTLDPWNGIR